MSRFLSLQGRALAVQEGDDLCVKSKKKKGLLPFGSPASYTFLSHPVRPTPHVWPALGLRPGPHHPRQPLSSPQPIFCGRSSPGTVIALCVPRAVTATEIVLSACFTFQAWHGPRRCWGGAQAPLYPVCWGSATALICESGCSGTSMGRLRVNT